MFDMFNFELSKVDEEKHMQNFLTHMMGIICFFFFNSRKIKQKTRRKKHLLHLQQKKSVISDDLLKVFIENCKEIQ